MMRYFIGHNYAYPMMGFGGGWILWIVGALVVALVVILIVRAVRNPVHSTVCAETAAGKEDSVAMRILDERYAKGAITDEEYRTKKSNLL